jgi:hypothetical protein
MRPESARRDAPISIGFEINTEEWVKPALQLLQSATAAGHGTDAAMTKLMANDR